MVGESWDVFTKRGLVEASRGFTAPVALSADVHVPSVFVVVLLAFSLLLSQVKLVWEAFPETFFLHGHTI